MRSANLIRFVSASLAFKLFGRRRPLNVMLGLTDRCTGSCSYCSIPERRSDEMSLPEILTLLVEAADLGCRRLGLWGGEPSCRSKETTRYSDELPDAVNRNQDGIGNLTGKELPEGR